MSNNSKTKESGFLRLSLETKASDGLFEGYGAVFGNVDLGGDMILPGAFAASLLDHKRKGTSPVMLWQHKQDIPIGRWLSLEEDAIGLKVKGKLNLGTSAGRDAFAHISDGDVSGLSIGYTVPSGGLDALPSGIAQIKAASLVEVSIVTLPMNERARIQLGSKGDLETLLTKSGLAREAARRIAQGGWPALSSSKSSTFNAARLIEAVTKSAGNL